MSSSYIINLKMMKYLDLLDEIPYKYIKEFIHKNDEVEYVIEMEHLNCESNGYCETNFTFTITINGIERTFKKVLYYNNSSPTALAIMEIENEGESDEETSEGETTDDEEEEEEEESTDDEEEEEEEESTDDEEEEDK